MKIYKFCLLTLAALVLSNCATKPILQPDEMVQITEVRVTKLNKAFGSENLEEDVRVKTQNTAYRVSETGTEKALKVAIGGYSGPSPARALFVGGSTFIQASIQLVDLDSDAMTKPESVSAGIYRQGGLLGAAAAAAINPYEEEKSLASLLAEQIIRKIYGDLAMQRTQTRTATKSATANYPISYEAGSQRFKCRRIEAENDVEREHAEEKGDEPYLKRVPAYCSKYPKAS